MFPSGWRYYVQLVQEGIPPQKHETGKGRVGIDIGTSTIAAVSKDGCILEELGDPASSPAEECLLQRKLDRSRRSMNPNNYKEDGSVKKGKKTWKKSKTYQAVQNQLKSLRRQKAARLKQWQEAEANKIAAMGNKVFVETMDFKALQKRAKNTERQEQTSIVKQKDGTEKKVHKYKKKNGLETLSECTPPRSSYPYWNGSCRTTKADFAESIPGNSKPANTTMWMTPMRRRSSQNVTTP